MIKIKKNALDTRNANQVVSLQTRSSTDPLNQNVSEQQITKK